MSEGVQGVQRIREGRSNSKNLKMRKMIIAGCPKGWSGGLKWSERGANSKNMKMMKMIINADSGMGEGVRGGGTNSRTGMPSIKISYKSISEN